MRFGIAHSCKKNFYKSITSFLAR